MSEGSRTNQRQEKLFQLIGSGLAIEAAARATHITVRRAQKFIDDANRKPPEQIEAEKAKMEAEFAIKVKNLIDRNFSMNGISRELKADRKRIARIIRQHGWSIAWTRGKMGPVPVADVGQVAVASPASVVRRRGSFDDPIPCLQCLRKFKSWGPGNRRCQECRKKD